MRFHPILLLFLLVVAPALGQPLPLADRGFLVEEAWRADTPVVQHALAFSDGGWTYTWTQEWAAPESRHRLGYSAPVSFGDRSDPSLGTLSLDYACQFRGKPGDRVSASPRASLLVPLEGSSDGNAEGTGFEIALPVTVVHGDKLATHWTLRAGRPGKGEPLESSFGFGAVRLVGERTIAVLEAELRALPRRERSNPEITLSAGVRWSFEPLASLGIVPGIAVPVTFTSGEATAGVMFHVMFEQTLGKRE